MMYDVATGVSLDTLHRLRVCSGGERVAGYYRFLKKLLQSPTQGTGGIVCRFATVRRYHAEQESLRGP